MRVIQASSVDEAYERAYHLMEAYGEESPSRNGRVFSPPFPVVTAYTFPQRRVILNRHRDANPFFHLFESLWMMCGRKDAKWLDQFVSDFSARYAEEDGTQHGGYGFRWRRHFGVDQLQVAIARLQRDPTDRRVVIQMWDANSDLFDPKDQMVEPRDVPCNTQIYPRIVRGKLDITVTCRSNDVVWGAYGANAVHFSILHEYLAGRLGVPMGIYYQVSNNWHLYEAVRDKFQPDETLDWGVTKMTVPIGNEWEHWLDDAFKFCLDPFSMGHDFKNSWFREVPSKMALAYSRWKHDKNRLAARQVADSIVAADWRRAVTDWMDRRS